MRSTLRDSLHQLARERDVPEDRLVVAFQDALAAGYRKHTGTTAEVMVELDDLAAQGYVVYASKVAVENVRDQSLEISLEEAREIDPETQVGDMMYVEESTDDLGRIAAQTVKQALTDGIRRIEREAMIAEYQDKVGEVVQGLVQRMERGDIVVSLGRGEAFLPRSEQMRGDHYRFGERIDVLLYKLDPESPSLRILVSRTHPDLLRRLFEREVPEISEGLVEIVRLAREPGVRSKVAVASRDGNVDPVGACVGHRGSRVQAVGAELGEEKIDVIHWYSDPVQFVQEALKPARITRVILGEDRTSATVVVADDQQSLAIGRGGQNVRLAARVTDLRLDIRSETQMLEEQEGAAAAPVESPGAEDAAPES
ncbi:MAG TPA: transcription termination/antitermination protein NusA [Armatimonadetes bacterium]|nr:transcription termination/antitermination protein NusA [Armatimonadota bacterium]